MDISIPFEPRRRSRVLLPVPKPTVPHGRERMSCAEFGGLRSVSDTPGREFGTSSHLAEGGLFDPFNGPQTHLPRTGVPVLSSVEKSRHPLD